MLNNITKLAYAKSLLENNFSIIPIIKGQKIPPFSHKLLEVKPNIVDLENWFEKSDYDMALAGGSVSGNLICLDFDEKYQAGLYLDWYSTLTVELKAIIDTCQHSKTRNDGRHIRFRTNSSKPTIKCAILEDRNAVIETRNEGAYALIPPSEGYENISGDLLNLPTISDEVYVQILASFKPFDYSKNHGEDNVVDAYKSSHKAHLLPSEWCEINMSFQDMLNPLGWKEIGKDKWARPNKKDAGISATTNYAGLPMFYCFTSNGHPFEANKPYSKLQMYALINHNGDTKSAVKYLAETNADFREKCSNIIEVKKEYKVLPLTRWSDLKNQDFGTQAWWVKNLIPKDAFVILASVSGEGKSWLSYNLANCIVSGKNFLEQENFKTIQGNVLYLDAENGNRIIQKRGRQLQLNDKMLFSNLADFSLNEVEGIKQLENIIIQEKIDVVFVDTFRAVAGGIKEERADEIRTFFNRFKYLKDRGVSFVFLDHHRKPNGLEGGKPKKEILFGSQDKTSGVDILLMLKKEGEQISVYQPKNRVDPEIEPFKLKISDVFDENGTKFTTLSYLGEMTKEESKKDEAKNIIMDILNDGGEYHREALLVKCQNEYDIGRTKCKEAIKELEQEKSIGVKKDGKKDTYFLRSESSVVSEFAI